VIRLVFKFIFIRKYGTHIQTCITFFPHLESSSSVYPFWCDVCDKGFAWRSKFERHLASAKHSYQSQCISPDDVLEDLSMTTNVRIEL